ncbi:hypothetical protein PA08_1977 [Cutibacterium modestum P08]|nr:hypothetical protein PA08_1977 [Cutibacterium modestum P08]
MIGPVPHMWSRADCHVVAEVLGMLQGRKRFAILMKVVVRAG